MQATTMPAAPADATRDSVQLPALLSAERAAWLLGISERGMHNIRNRPGFPLPVVLGERAVRWRTAELLRWIESRPCSQPQAEPAQLATAQARAARKAKLDARIAEKKAAQQTEHPPIPAPVAAPEAPVRPIRHRTPA